MDALQNADIGIEAGEGTDKIGGAIGRIVIDKNYFILNTLQRFCQTFENEWNVGTLCKRRNDYGELNVAGERHI